MDPAIRDHCRRRAVLQEARCRDRRRGRCLRQHRPARLSAVRRELGNKQSPRVRYHGFDLLYLGGYDLRDVPYLERKRLLEDLLQDAPDTLLYVEYLKGHGD